LNPLQEEMAVKFVQKFGTPYLQDRKFCFNFMEDFAEALGLREKATIQDFDWTPIVLAGIIDDNLTMHISAGAVMFLLGWFLRE